MKEARRHPLPPARYQTINEIQGSQPAPCYDDPGAPVLSSPGCRFWINPSMCPVRSSTAVPTPSTPE
ncbi:hypothetical protein VTJ04DRAFT_9961 [Mycothermus thermophilus]|uniref:uncharacterized protein n=1 Tax=Humicola insolens TaxID=85995 RepID=UPI003743F497